VKGRDVVQMTLSCGSEIVLNERTLRRAIAAIDAHRENHPEFK